MDIRKLQRAIVDGLEDVKAQHIVVFNTEALSPLFERVIIASGTSNRQTKALAASVRHAVRTSGQQVLRTEGEDNGEWIIVDCGAAVAHIMQPAIREYYRLEEIWGGKPVKLKLGDGGAAVSLPKAEEPQATRAVAPKATSGKAPAKKVSAKKAPARSTAAKAAAKKAPGRKAPVKAASGSKAPAKKVSGGKAPGKKAAAGTTRSTQPASTKKAPARKPASPTRAASAPRQPAARKTRSGAPVRARTPSRGG